MASAEKRLLTDASRLWTLISERYEEALRAGSVQPLATEVRLLEASGLDFVVRRLTREAGPRAKGGDTGSPLGGRSPFLAPYDPHLFVCRLSPTHVCLLNKYPVLARHTLLVTREFEEQEDRLGRDDFVAASIALRGVDGLVFYNSGPRAGASQRHRHLQLVVLPLRPGGHRTPVEPALISALAAGESRCSGLPFLHRLERLELDDESDPETAAEWLHATYLRCLASLELLPAPESRRPAPYNLLITRRWLCLVPRSRHTFRSIDVNALGFVGTFLVHTAEEMRVLTETGPLEVLRQVGVSRQPSRGCAATPEDG